MEQIKPRFQWETLTGEPIIVGDTTVTPNSHVLSIRLPFGGLVWNRPAAVVVERNGQTERIAILDVTRLAVWSILALSVAVTLLAWLAGRRS